MTGQGFLKKLHKDAILQLVTPSEEIKSAYLKKSESHLTSARLLLDNDLFEQSVSMAYYSMYYSVLALFFATGIKCENHTAAIILLTKVFALDNTDLEYAKPRGLTNSITLHPRRSVMMSLRSSKRLNLSMQNSLMSSTG